MKKIKRSELQPMKSECIDCGTGFALATDEVMRNKEKKIPLPTRCKACRRSKLIEIKLKRLTKLIFRVLGLIEGRKPAKKYEPKLQKEQKEGVATQEKS